MRRLPSTLLPTFELFSHVAVGGGSFREYREEGGSLCEACEP